VGANTTTIQGLISRYMAPGHLTRQTPGFDQDVASSPLYASSASFMRIRARTSGVLR
jgi:hypothetical protein